ncbi:hypothetical protein LVY72_02690 [Arthrobacter sp. I2-34]|uniref:DUF4398 domain-containing protein n=1 Tax=Arthrobacter hankyongi TaxID=2904801 RepID=A0ABS9L290_9MICC|nr:hypothetical protein [Arthrobacter hankyongi]MCG2620817.1 hypothetical protein [Arthrobacter hankyongi]
MDRTGIRRTRTGRAAARPVLAAAMLLLIAACSSGISGPLGKSADEASSAASSLALALRLETSGRATAAVAETTAENMLDETVKAYQSAASQEPSDGTELARQQEVLQALDRTLHSLQAARLTLAGGSAAEREAAVLDLEHQAAELSRLGKELKP